MEYIFKEVINMTEEFRILYQRDNAVGTDYHYYRANDAAQALQFQLDAIKHKGWDINLLTIERYDRYADKWIDESEVLHGVQR